MREPKHHHILSAEQEASCRRRVQDQPHAIQPRARLALHCWRSGELADALEWIESCLELDRTNVDLYRLRANIQVDLQLTGQALATAREARELAPDSIPAHLLLVRMLLADLQPAKAQQALDTVLQLGPDVDQLHQMKSLQEQILSMTRLADRDPLKWLTLKFRKRKANLAGEKKRSS